MDEADWLRVESRLVLIRRRLRALVRVVSPARRCGGVSEERCYRSVLEAMDAVASAQEHAYDASTASLELAGGDPSDE